MARAVTILKQLTAASATVIAGSQMLGAAGNLTLTANPVVLDTQRRVLITSGGDDSGITFTVVGTNDAGTTISETVAGTNMGTVATLQDFKTVSQVSTSGATASTVTVGTNTTGSTPWQVPNYHITPPSVNIGTELLSGSATWSIQVTSDSPLMPIYPLGVNNPVPIPYPVEWPQISGVSVNTAGVINSGPQAWRLTITSGTGQVQVTGTQSGIAGPG